LRSGDAIGQQTWWNRVTLLAFQDLVPWIILRQDELSLQEQLRPDYTQVYRVTAHHLILPHVQINDRRNPFIFHLPGASWFLC
jgi:hypothetical protein